MKILYIFLITLLHWSPGLTAHAQVSVQDSTEYHKITHIIEEVKAEYAPDKRTALFELQSPEDGSSARYEVITTEAEALPSFRERLADHHIAETKITINLLPDSGVGENVSGIVNLSVANLRVTPGNQAELASQVLLGATVDLLQKQHGYYRVRTPEGYIAWVATSSITPMTPLEVKRWKSANRVIVTADFGYSYSQPDHQSLRVSDLVMGNLLTTLGQSGNFYHVQYPDGRLAYVDNELVRPFDAWLGTREVTAENVLTIAKSMMGVPYLWGGTSVKGVDCSGFTKTAYLMNGVIIPRDASQQVLVGEPIDILSAGELDIRKALRNLRPADLLFFASGKGRSPDARITHVALYLGKGEFIHAAGTVRINSMLPNAPNYSDFQSRTLVSARRYVGQDDPGLQPVASNSFYQSATTDNR
ncbi:NlpC/P60 family protein [Parapedobacter flavus]|uniref:C40 family peptidase n=1 Tax=Parapedobacter flavus TaxID=3110225 RepID=UPI002DB84452|nr:NlpC/P60 family protein [Parapedobacter sp. 10938]MEC3881044.1 NlpC/P60 family protein [Parapedobacter sp. 10938]